MNVLQNLAIMEAKDFSVKIKNPLDLIQFYFSVVEKDAMHTSYLILYKTLILTWPYHGMEIMLKMTIIMIR